MRQLCDDQAIVEAVAEKLMAQAKPRWNWTGVEALVFDSQDSRLRDLLTMLPAKKSSDDEIVAFLVDLRARFQRWLHQDEFGPTRGEQAAGVHALMREVQTLQRLLVRSSPSPKARFEARLRDRNDPSNTVLEALYEAADDIEHDFRKANAPNSQVAWASRLRDCVYSLMARSQALDTNADSEIFLIAAERKFQSSLATGANVRFADAEHWLTDYWNVLFDTLQALNERRGAEERVSVKLLIEQLCDLWERETQTPVTVHGIVKDVYASRGVTDAGRFVTAALEAMLPQDESWVAEHPAQSVRAVTLLPGHGPDRERHVIRIMRDYVERRHPRPEAYCSKTGR
jgi:hypothetical protein